MKKFLFILFCGIGLSLIMFAGGRSTSLEKGKASNHEFHFIKKSDDVLSQFIAEEPLTIDVVDFKNYEMVSVKTVKLFDLVTNPFYSKGYRLYYG